MPQNIQQLQSGGQVIQQTATGQMLTSAQPTNAGITMSQLTQQHGQQLNADWGQGRTVSYYLMNFCGGK